MSGLRDCPAGGVSAASAEPKAMSEIPLHARGSSTASLRTDAHQQYCAHEEQGHRVCRSESLTEWSRDLPTLANLLREPPIFSRNPSPRVDWPFRGYDKRARTRNHEEKADQTKDHRHLPSVILPPERVEGLRLLKPKAMSQSPHIRRSSASSASRQSSRVTLFPSSGWPWYAVIFENGTGT